MEREGPARGNRVSARPRFRDFSPGAAEGSSGGSWRGGPEPEGASQSAAARADWLLGPAGREPGCGRAVAVAVAAGRLGALGGSWRPGRMAQGWAGFSEEELRRLKQSKGNGTRLCAGEGAELPFLRGLGGGEGGTRERALEDCVEEAPGLRGRGPGASPEKRGGSFWGVHVPAAGEGGGGPGEPAAILERGPEQVGPAPGLHRGGRRSLGMGAHHAESGCSAARPRDPVCRVPPLPRSFVIEPH